MDEDYDLEDYVSYKYAGGVVGERAVDHAPAPHHREPAQPAQQHDRRHQQQEHQHNHRRHHGGKRDDRILLLFDLNGAWALQRFMGRGTRHAIARQLLVGTSTHQQLAAAPAS
jgi:hypothetical protein